MQYTFVHSRFCKSWRNGIIGLNPVSALTRFSNFTKFNACLDFFSIVVSQPYETDVIREYAITGNSAILKCQVPSFVADFITVSSWHTDKNEDIYPGENYGLIHKYSQHQSPLNSHLL